MRRGRMLITAISIAAAVSVGGTAYAQLVTPTYPPPTPSPPTPTPVVTTTPVPTPTATATIAPTPTGSSTPLPTDTAKPEKTCKPEETEVAERPGKQTQQSAVRKAGGKKDKNKDQPKNKHKKKKRKQKQCVPASSSSGFSTTAGPLLAGWLALAGIVGAFFVGSRGRRRRPAAIAGGSTGLPRISTTGFVPRPADDPESRPSPPGG